MDEKQLDLIFREFLLTKEYQNKNILSQVVLRSNGRKVIRPDLVIIDIENKQYIAIVEFKNSINDQIKTRTLEQFFNYFDAIGNQIIPCFLVYPISDTDFEILVMTENLTFEPISKDDFPTFETLYAKQLTEEKLKEKELEHKTLKELNLKKNKAIQMSYLSIVSLILGVIASFITIYFQQSEFGKTKNTETNCCDSVQIIYSKVNSKIENLEKKIYNISVSKNKVDTVYTSEKIKGFEQRIKTIENGISNNPEKTLSILQLHYEIEQLKKSDEFIKELDQEKINSLNEKLNTLNGFLVGLFVTIFGAILSYAFTNLRLNKKENDN